MIINLFKKYQLFLDCNLYVSLRRTEIRKGLCSKNFDTDKHMLLWDFDEVPLQYIMADLQSIQYKYGLPDVYVLESSENHYHAYCFVSMNFKTIIQILSYSIFIDENYFRLGVARGYYTLRYSPKGDRNIRLISILKSNVKYTMSPLEVTINEYYTTNIK